MREASFAGCAVASLRPVWPDWPASVACTLASTVLEVSQVESIATTPASLHLSAASEAGNAGLGTLRGGIGTGARGCLSCFVGGRLGLMAASELAGDGDRDAVARLAAGLISWS